MRRYVRLAVVLAVQLAILVAIPLPQVLARYRGTPVTLRTAPVDPFDVLAGHYVTLSYEVERESMQRHHDPAHGAPRVEPGLSNGDRVWLTVKSGDPAWTLVGVTRERPAPAPGQVSIRARWTRGVGAQLEDASRLYVTEAQGKAADARAWGDRQADLVELRVDEDGTPAVMRLRGPGLDLRAE